MMQRILSTHQPSHMFYLQEWYTLPEVTPLANLQIFPPPAKHIFLKNFLTNMIGHLWWGEQKSDFTQLFQSVNFHPVLWRFSIRDQLKILYIFYSYAIWPLSFIHLNSVSLCAGISTLYNLGVSALNTSWQSCKHGCGLFVLRRRNCNSPVQGHS